MLIAYYFIQILYKVGVDEKAMNSIDVKIVSLLKHCKTDSKSKTLQSGKVIGDLFPDLLKSMELVQKKSFHMPSNPLKAGSTVKKGNYLYLESLRKALLGKGKSLNTISLHNKDIPVLEKFLWQCGFSQEDVEDLLKELLQNNPYGEINLSQFFHKISELGPAKGKEYQSITLEPSAIPHIESALKDLNLTTGEIDHVLTSARIEGGRMDLNKFVIKLKEMGHKEMPLRSKHKLDQFVKVIEEMIDRSAEFKGLAPENQVKSAHNIADQTSKKLPGIVIQMPNKEISEEQVTERIAEQSRLPAEVKATIDQILEKVAMAEEKDGAISTKLFIPKLGLTDLYFKEKRIKESKMDEKESLLSPSKEKENLSVKNGRQRPESILSSEKATLFSDLDAGKARSLHLSPAERSTFSSGFNGGITKGEYSFSSETRTIDISQNISSSALSELINAGKQNLEPIMDALPTYLIDQVGRQIARSIRSGERIFSLQLKPPELGTLRIKMDIKGNALKLGMIAENNSAKELLLSNVHELREALVEQGVKLERLDITINYDFGQSLANSKEGLKEWQRWGQEMNGVLCMTESDMEKPLSGPSMVVDDRLLDLVA
jgi:flagellar hook-length control protein FliK